MKKLDINEARFQRPIIKRSRCEPFRGGVANANKVVRTELIEAWAAVRLQIIVHVIHVSTSVPLLSTIMHLVVKRSEDTG